MYRGQSPGMQGLYFYADYVTDQLWTFRIVGGAAVDVTNRTQQIVADGGDIDQISSFAEDSQGNLYILQLDGEIHRLSPHAAAGDGADTIDGGAETIASMAARARTSFLADRAPTGCLVASRTTRFPAAEAGTCFAVGLVTIV